MVTCSGKSLIPLSFDVYQKFMNSVVPPEKLPTFNIKLDGRANVKSVFAKLVGTDLTIYTGAIVNLGGVQFSEVPDAESLLMLFTIYGVKKAGTGSDFEIKATAQYVSALKTDPDFKALAGQVHFFMDKFRPLNSQAISTPVPTPAPAPVSTPAPVPTSAPISATPSVEQSQVENTAVVSEVKETKAKTKKEAGPGVSPYKDVPLGDTPKIEVPADLDLRTV